METLIDLDDKFVTMADLSLLCEKSNIEPLVFNAIFGLYYTLKFKRITQANSKEGDTPLDHHYSCLARLFNVHHKEILSWPVSDFSTGNITVETLIESFATRPLYINREPLDYRNIYQLGVILFVRYNRARDLIIKKDAKLTTTQRAWVRMIINFTKSGNAHFIEHAMEAEMNAFRLNVKDEFKERYELDYLKKDSWPTFKLVFG